MHSYQPESKICEPEYSAWAELLSTESNLAIDILGKQVDTDFIRQLRCELLNACREYTQKYLATTITVLKDRPICMYGHQPVVYHSGLIAKQKMQLAFANSQSLNSLELIIDTDLADPVSVLLPKKQGSLSAFRIKLAEGQGCYLFQKAKKTSMTELVSQGLDEKYTKQVAEFLEEWNKHDQLQVVVASVALRRKYLDDNKTLVLPISELMKLPTMKEVLGLLMLDLPRLVEIYNQILDNYRRNHKIKNQANPFPNMEFKEQLLELPFWYINLTKQARQALYYNSSTGQLISEALVVGTASTIFQSNYGQSFILAPRGMLTTFLLRVFCSDFFIHGLGGAKYDQATDYFISALTTQKPKPFIAVSETRYLYPKLAEEYLNDLEIIAKEREVLNHPEKYLNLVVNDNAKVELKALTDQAQAIRARLIVAKQAKQESALIQKELSEVNLQIRALLEREVFSELKNKLKIIEKQADLVFCREFPYFLFGR